MVLGRNRRRTQAPLPYSAAAGPAQGAPIQGALRAASILPYDYAAAFRLTGNPGNVIQDVLNISPDGVFVATGISYGFEPESASGDIGRTFTATVLPPPSPMPTPPPVLSNGLVLPGRITLAELPLDALINGFRVNPSFDHLVFPPAAGSVGTFSDAVFATNLNQGVPPDFSRNLFQKLRSASPLSFLFNFVDTGTGREMQDAPLHNVASLGIANGDRPFRMLARPVTFLPRSNLRLQVIEQSLDTPGTLFIVLNGYKMLGLTSLSEAEARALARSPVAPVPEPQGPVVPFDYVTTFELTGRPGNEIVDEIAVNVEGGFVATALGYGIATAESRVELRRPVLNADTRTLNLGNQLLSVFSPDALRDGIRVRPAMARIAFASSSSLAATLPKELANEIFERMSKPEEVSFRYNIHDTARGRDLQNRPINNIAGLGIADGSRPFRNLLRPLRVLPRTTLRVTVEERAGRGRLYIVFQGYKMLSARA